MLVIAVFGISGAAIATGAAMTGQPAADGQVQVSIADRTSSAPGATTPGAPTTTIGGAVDTQAPTTITNPPTSPSSGGLSQGSSQQQAQNPVTSGGGSSGGSANANSAQTPAPPAPPVKTTPAAPKPVNIGGQLTCSSGKSIEGVWVSTTTGSGYAPWQGLGNNVSKYWYTLPESEPYSVHVGCGGTQQYWAVACYGPQVTNPTDSFECFDVDGASGYETCSVH